MNGRPRSTYPAGAITGLLRTANLSAWTSRPAPELSPPTADRRAPVSTVRALAWRTAPVANVDVDTADDLLTVSFFDGIADREADPFPDLSIGFVEADGVPLVTTICLDGISRWFRNEDSVALARHLLGPTVVEQVSRGEDLNTDVVLGRSEAEELVEIWTVFAAHWFGAEVDADASLEVELAGDRAGRFLGKREVPLRHIVGAALASLPASVTASLDCQLDDDGLRVRLNASLPRLPAPLQTLCLGMRLAGDRSAFSWLGSPALTANRPLQLTAHLAADSVSRQGRRAVAQVQFLARRVLASQTWPPLEQAGQLLLRDTVFRALFDRARSAGEQVPALTVHRVARNWAVTALMPSPLPPDRDVVIRMGVDDRQCLVPLRPVPEPAGGRGGRCPTVLHGSGQLPEPAEPSSQTLTLEVVEAGAG